MQAETGTCLPLYFDKLTLQHAKLLFSSPPSERELSKKNILCFIQDIHASVSLIGPLFEKLLSCAFKVCYKISHTS